MKVYEVIACGWEGQRCYGIFSSHDLAETIQARVKVLLDRYPLYFDDEDTVVIVEWELDSQEAMNEAEAEAKEEYEQYEDTE